MTRQEAVDAAGRAFAEVWAQMAAAGDLPIGIQAVDAERAVPADETKNTARRRPPRAA